MARIELAPHVLLDFDRCLVALHRFVAAMEVVFVISIRGQRESGYRS